MAELVQTKESTRIGSVKERISGFESSHTESNGYQRMSSTGSTTISSTRSSTLTNGSTTIGSTYGSDNGYATMVKETTYLVDRDLTREEEKGIFVSLNDRLARYIETIRGLNLSRESLALLIEEQKRAESSLKEKLEALYLSKINDSNYRIEQLSMENSKLALELKKIKADYEDQRNLVAKLEADLAGVEDERRRALAEVEDLIAKLRAAENRLKDVERQNMDLKQGASGFQRRLDDLRNQLEAEARNAAQWQSKYDALKKELALAEESHSTLMSEYRREHSLEIQGIIDRMRADYDARLLAELQSLRQNFEERLRINNLEIEKMYKIDLSAVDFDAKRLVSEAIEAKNEASRLRLRINELETLIASHESTVSGLRKRISELEGLVRIGDDFGGFFKTSLANLKNEWEEKIREYRYLLDLKIQLDTELNAYHTLLSGEEYRLHIHRVEPVQDNSGRTFVSKGHSDVDVVIDEVNMNGNYIHLTNKGKKDFDLSSWLIKAEAGGAIRKFKFQSKLVLGPGKSITIWSPNRGGDHNPPESIVMKAVVWPAGEKIRVELLNEDEKMKGWLTSYYEVDEVKTSETVTTLHKSTMIL